MGKAVNAANLLSLSRVCATPFVICLMYGGSAGMRYGALVLFAAAMLTDVFDGLLARRGERTVLGNYLDPVADKTLILCLFVALADRGMLPLWMGLVLIARELIVSGVRNVGAARGRVVGANWMGKTKTVFQVATICWALFLLARVRGGEMRPEFRQTLPWRSLWGFGCLTVALSVVFAVVFLVWNRDLIIGRAESGASESSPGKGNESQEKR